MFASKRSHNSNVLLLVLTLGILVLAGTTGTSTAATLVVNGFGAGGWYSWDTRSPSGAQLVGINDTHPFGPTYFGVAATAASDTAIEKQIIFMGEGQTVNTENGNPPPGPSPTGSLNSLGYVRLEGTSSNSGKSDISYVNTSGIAPASDLLLPTFSTTYRYNIEPNPTFRTLGLNISLIGTDARNYTFAHIQDGSAQPTATPGWNTEIVNNVSGQFSLFVSGVGGIGSNTLAGWALDPTYGPLIYGNGSEIYRMGFNIGSSQRQAEQYLDFMQTNLLNGGDIIDFQAPAVPEPASLSLLGLGVSALLLRRRRRD